jgi:hypothetical protein
VFALKLAFGCWVSMLINKELNWIVVILFLIIIIIIIMKMMMDLNLCRLSISRKTTGDILLLKICFIFIHN